MKNSIMMLSAALMLGGVAHAQKVAFEEYNLDNGMHVILHNDPSAPVVITSVMYHVGSKDVAFPRLNSIGFWIQPCGYLLLAKTAFLRPQF